MDELTVKTLLNTLADWQSQKDLLNMDKRKLLEEVKVPDEVQAIVSAGMDEMATLQSQYEPELKNLREETEQKLKEIVVPEEIREAFAAIDRQRLEATKKLTDYQDEIAEKIAARKIEITEKIETATAGVFKANAQRKADIEAEFSGKSGALDENIAKLTEQIKNAVKEIGFTVDGEFYQARYTKPKKSWIPQRLEKYTEDHPEIQSCYTLGDPSVAIVRK